MIANCLSVDLESVSHREFNLLKRVNSGSDKLIETIKNILDLFNKFSAKATFFVVGELYDQYPQLINEIKARGHEIAYHTHRHVLLKTKADLINELKLSRKFLQKFHPIGFRAPRMFFRQEYFPILAASGFKYDSSSYDNFSSSKNYYGIKEFPVSLFSFFPDSNLNFPKNFSRSLIKGLPFGAGLSLSFFGKHTQTFINLINRRRQPAILFFHPWQFTPYNQKILLKDMYNIPRLIYKLPINQTLEYLLSKNKFTCLKELL